MLTTAVGVIFLFMLFDFSGKASIWSRAGRLALAELRPSVKIPKPKRLTCDDYQNSAALKSVAELERNLIIERVRAGLRRARLEGRAPGRKPIEIDRMGLLRDRARGLSLAQLAKTYKISRTKVAKG